jgi:signal transduction histidine kinase/Tfp pilus assembly protein PilF
MHRLTLIILFTAVISPIFLALSQDKFFTGQNIDSLFEQSEASPPQTRIEIGEFLLQNYPTLTSSQRARAYTEVGMGHFRQNRFQSAISNFDMAAELYLNNEDSIEHSKVLNLTGIALSRLRQFPLAIEKLKQALKIREAIGDTIPIASTLNNLATCFKATNQIDAALQAYQRSHGMYSQINDLAGQSFTLNNLGLILMSQKSYDEAITHFTKSLEFKKLLADTLNIATTYGNLGTLFELTNDYNKSLQYYLIAAELFDCSHNYYGLADTYNSLASLHIKLAQPSKAFSYISRAEKLIKEEESTSLALNNLRIRSDYYLSTGNIEKSRELLLNYTQKLEEVFNNRISDQVAELSYLYQNQRQEQENKILQIHLDFEKLKNQKARTKQYGIVVSALLLLLLLIVALIFIRHNRKKNIKLQNVVAELNHMNTQLEGIVENRTHDLLSILNKAQESDKQKSAFLANMSHQIRTPLNGILGFTRILNDDSLSVSEKQQYVDLINRRGRNLLQIVNDIINISLIDSGQVEIRSVSFNLNQLLYDLYSLFNSPEYDKKKQNVGLKLSLSLSDSRSIIASDPTRIEQVLTNLIDNSLKYTYEGTIEYGYELLPNNTIKFFVKDTGHGIPEEMRDKVFGRFYKTNEDLPYSHNSIGLGLPICKGLVELMNGKIWFETIIDNGTTFYFTIPFAPGKQDPKAYVSRSSVSSQNLSFKGKVILVVEDDLISYQYIEALLKTTDAKLIHAKNGEDAIEIAKLREDIDLILMDMRLPFIDGYEATAQIKSFNPTLTIIAQTANAMSYDRDKCIFAGCDDYIPKPVDPDDFLRIISHYLNRPVLI